MIPLTFNTNEITGKNLVNNGEDDNLDISDMVSISGSVVNVNTRNSVSYKRFYDNQVINFKKACGKKMEESEANFSETASARLMGTRVPGS